MLRKRHTFCPQLLARMAYVASIFLDQSNYRVCAFEHLSLPLTLPVLSPILRKSQHTGTEGEKNNVEKKNGTS